MDRERLLAALSDLRSERPHPLDTDGLAALRIPPRGAFLASWAVGSGDPNPDILVVNDADLDDTFAFVSAYSQNIIPLTQWCRVCSMSELPCLLSSARAVPFLGSRLFAWVGAIIAECNAQAGGVLDLRTMAGGAATATATFAAARATAIYGSSVDLADLAARYERLGNHARPTPGTLLSAASLGPLWSVLAGRRSDQELDPTSNALEHVARLFEELGGGSGGPTIVAEAVVALAARVKLPELSACAKGAQFDRVAALDALVVRLADGPATAARDALAGIGASLVEPGATVLPRLLADRAAELPTARLWLGAFAGLTDPAKVGGDYSGLGRLVSKPLTAAHDLRTKPASDIAYEEFWRWLPLPLGSKLPVRGLATRALSVELMPGVACSFPVAGFEQARPEKVAHPATTTHRASAGNRSRILDEPSAGQFETLAAEIKALELRLQALEKVTTDRQGGAPDFFGKEGGTQRRRGK